jgi:hypothetical protein
MGDLRRLAIAAHGGLDRWNQLSTMRAHQLVGGALWALKQQDGILSDTYVQIQLHRQFASHSPFGKPRGFQDVAGERGTRIRPCTTC